MGNENTPLHKLMTWNGEMEHGGEAGHLSLQKKSKRRLKILLLVVLIAAVIFGIDAAARYRPAYVKQWLQSHLSSPGLPEYHYRVSDIVRIFDKYGAEAEAFFDGRNVCVLGIVIDEIGAVTLVPAESSSAGAQINCYMRDSGKASGLRKGESVAVYGECSWSQSTSSVSLRGCVIAN